MDTGEFYKVVKELHQKIQSTGLSSHVNTIIQNLAKLQQQGQSSPQNKQQIYTAIENGRREVKAVINTIIPATISVEDSKVYEALNAYSLFGFEGQQTFDSAFAQFQTNPSQALQIIQQFNRDFTRISQLFNAFSPYADKVSSNVSQLDSKDLIILFFQAGAEINNLDEMAKVSSKWNQVLISFALLARETDRTFRIETVERGSIILTLSAITGVVLAFGNTAEKVLDVIKKYYEIKKIAHSAKQLPGVPEKVITELDESSKLKLNAETTEITNQLLDKYGWKDDPQMNEVNTAVTIAVRHLLKFVNKGGKVDVRLIADTTPEQKEVQINLTLKYNAIKEIENKISVPEGQKQLLDMNDANENDSHE
jgi:hypothetical protein